MENWVVAPDWPWKSLQPFTESDKFESDFFSKLRGKGDSDGEEVDEQSDSGGEEQPVHVVPD
jgi:hypothetical protein